MSCDAKAVDARRDELVLILRRYDEHCTHRDPEPGLTFAQLSVLPEREVLDPLAFLADPVRAALRGRARDIGWRTLTEGGHAAMLDLYDLVVMDPGIPRAGAHTLDHWWDGIGTWVA